ncbi:hypothetical protein GCM10009677_50300 [Sphaerisporangium rubeum]
MGFPTHTNGPRPAFRRQNPTHNPPKTTAKRTDKPLNGPVLPAGSDQKRGKRPQKRGRGAGLPPAGADRRSGPGRSPGDDDQQVGKGTPTRTRTHPARVKKGRPRSQLMRSDKDRQRPCGVAVFLDQGQEGAVGGEDADGARS